MSRCSGFMYVRTYPLAPIMPSWTSWRPIASIASKKRTETNGVVTKLKGKEILGTLVVSTGFGRTRVMTRNARMGRTTTFGIVNEKGNTTMRSRSGFSLGVSQDARRIRRRWSCTCDDEHDQSDDASPACINLILGHLGAKNCKAGRHADGAGAEVYIPCRTLRRAPSPQALFDCNREASLIMLSVIIRKLLTARQQSAVGSCVAAVSPLPLGRLLPLPILRKRKQRCRLVH